MCNFKKYLVVILLIMFMNLTNVIGLSSSLGPIKQVGSRVMDNCSSGSCYGTALKVSGSTPVICTEYNKETPAAGGATCSISSDWNEKVRYGVAAIISKVKSNVNATSLTNQYFAAEMAINRFLYNKGVGGADITGSVLSNTYRSLYIDYLDLANEAYDNYSSASKVEITLSKSSLTFTLDDSNYVSNKITVSGVDSYSVETSVGTVSKSGNSFTVSVPKKNIDKTTTVKVTVSSSKSLNQARNYDCGSNYQTITPVALETVKKSDSKSLSGTITIEKEDPKAKLTINKVDTNNNHLSGATLKITGPNGYSKVVTSSGSSITLENLELGTYTITETTAPSGYIKAKAQTISLTSSNLSGTVTIKNNKNKVSISKLDITGTSELPGATLQVQDESGKTLYEWVSTNTPYIIEGLSSGTYYLIETIAPSGYVLNKEKVKFIITNDTVEEKIQMTNKLNIVRIYKLNAVDKRGLAGATLEVQDANGTVIKYCTDAKGNKNTECKWESTTEPYEISGLPVGKYYLIETKAPVGYELNTKKTEFIVESTSDEIQVILENELEVEVPDTLSSRSALLLTIAMFDIALGIGIITYVKKNKIEQ